MGLVRFWGPVATAAVAWIATVAWAFAALESAEDVATLAVSSGFLIVTVLYVVETHRLVVTSQEAVQFERRRYDDERLGTLRQTLLYALRRLDDLDQTQFPSFGLIRAWPLDGESTSDPTSETLRTELLADMDVLDEWRAAIRREDGMLLRNGLGETADEAVALLSTYSRVLLHLSVLTQRKEAHGTPRERLAYLASAWEGARDDLRVPPWDHAVGSGQLVGKLSQALSELARGIDRTVARR